MGFNVLLRSNNSYRLMSALGQEQTSRPEISMSALPPKAEIVHGGGNVRFVPTPDVSNRSGTMTAKHPGALQELKRRVFIKGAGGWSRVEPPFYLLFSDMIF